MDTENAGLGIRNAVLRAEPSSGPSCESGERAHGGLGGLGFGGGVLIQFDLPPVQESLHENRYRLIRLRTVLKQQRDRSKRGTVRLEAGSFVFYMCSTSLV